MNSRFIIPILVVGALAFACGPRPNEASTPSAAAVTQVSPPKRQREPRPASIRQSMAAVVSWMPPP